MTTTQDENEQKLTIIIKNMEQDRETETLKTKEFAGEDKQTLWKEAMTWLDGKYANWRRKLAGQEISLSAGTASIKAIYEARHPLRRNAVYIYY